MKRILRVLGDPWFGVGIGIACVGVNITELLIRRKRSQVWDEALSEELKADDGGVR